MVLSEPLSTEIKITEKMDKLPGELLRSGPYSSKYGSGVGEVEAYSIIYSIQLLEKSTVEKNSVYMIGHFPSENSIRFN